MNRIAAQRKGRRATSLALLLLVALPPVRSTASSLAACTVLPSELTRPTGKAQASDGRIEGYETAECIIRVPKAGRYTLIVVARGEHIGGDWPLLEMSANNVVALRASLDTTNSMSLAREVDLPAGLCFLTLSLANGRTTAGHLRHAWVASLTIVSPSDTAAAAPLSAVEIQNLRRARNRDLVAQAAQRIPKARRGVLRVRVTDAQGRAADNVAVEVEQVRHAFLFGAVLNPSWFEDADARPVEWGRSEARRLFNAIRPDETLSWAALEPHKGEPDWSALDRMAAWCRKEQLVFRGPLFFGSDDSCLPSWTEALTDDDLQKACARYARELAAHLREDCPAMDVAGRLLDCPGLCKRLGVGLFAELLREARSGSSKAALYIGSSMPSVPREATHFLDQLRAWIESGAPVGGLGVEVHWDSEPDLKRVQDTFDALAALHLPIVITDFSCAGSEADQERWLAQFYTLAFSHPAIMGIFLQRPFSEGTPVEGLLRRADGSSTSVLGAYEDLVLDQWQTRSRGQTDAGGEWSASCFYGELRVTAWSPTGEKKEMQVSFAPGKTTPSVTIQFEPPPPEEEEPVEAPVEPPPEAPQRDPAEDLNKPVSR